MWDLLQYHVIIIMSKYFYNRIYFSMSCITLFIELEEKIWIQNRDSNKSYCVYVILTMSKFVLQFTESKYIFKKISVWYNEVLYN